MKIYNLTDVQTPALIQRGLVNVKIKVGPEVISPGSWAEVPDSQEVRSKLSQYEGLGALSRVAPSHSAPPKAPEASLPEAEAVAPVEPFSDEPAIEVSEESAEQPAAPTGKGKRKGRRK